MNLDQQIKRVEEANIKVLEEAPGDVRAYHLKIIGRIRELIISCDIELSDGRKIKPIKEAELDRLFSILIPNEVA